MEENLKNYKETSSLIGGQNNKMERARDEVRKKRRTDLLRTNRKKSKFCPLFQQIQHLHPPPVPAGLPPEQGPQCQAESRPARIRSSETGTTTSSTSL